MNKLFYLFIFFTVCCNPIKSGKSSFGYSSFDSGNSAGSKMFDCSALGIECRQNDPYQIQLTNKNIYFKNLPKELDGLRIGILTDLHIGYMDNKKLYKIINKFRRDPKSQKNFKEGKKPFDLFLFLGDLINYELNEIDEDKIHILKKLNEMSTTGVYSIIGNHDIGGYSFFSQRTPEKNFDQKMTSIHEDCLEWNLLRNRHDIIKVKGKKLKIIGIDHWGACTAIPNRGDLEKAKKTRYEKSRNKNIDDKEKVDFTILSAHDPSFFDNVCNETVKIPLTLSGHTHGLKVIGEALQKPKWSKMKNPFSKKFWKAMPFSTFRCRHKYPSGLYTHKKDHKYLYVDPGVGFAGLTKDLKFGNNSIKIDFSVPNRSGVKPNISILTLRKR